MYACLKARASGNWPWMSIASVLSRLVFVNMVHLGPLGNLQACLDGRIRDAVLRGFQNLEQRFAIPR